jgi:hypothetical protein
LPRSRTLPAVRLRSRLTRDRHRTSDPFSIAALKALRVLGDVRTRHVAVTARGYEYRLLTDRGENLLAATPRQHLRFLFFCAALVRAAGTTTPVALGDDLEAVLGAVARGEDTSAFTFAGAGYELRTSLTTWEIAAAIDELTRNVLVWTTAGEAFEPAVREVVADSYRRHRAHVRARR